jgi:PTH1 family peptidyl-tRNA hydrolase
MIEDLFLLVGLGNPGLKYKNTRHNVGFDTIDLLAKNNNIKVSRLKFKAYNGEGRIKGHKVILAKPQTFMNLSGESVRELAAWYKMDINNIILIYDDVDIPLGKIKIRPGGSSGTHNGMKSVIYHLQREDFPRIRIGIGDVPEGWDIADYVLSKFSKEEREVIDDSIARAVHAADMIINSGIEAAMNTYNA